MAGSISDAMSTLMSCVGGAARGSQGLSLWFRGDEDVSAGFVDAAVTVFAIVGGHLASALEGGVVRLVVPGVDITPERSYYYGHLVLRSCRILPYWACLQRDSLREVGSSVVPLRWLSCDDYAFQVVWRGLTVRNIEALVGGLAAAADGVSVADVCAGLGAEFKEYSMGRRRACGSDQSKLRWGGAGGGAVYQSAAAACGVGVGAFAQFECATRGGDVRGVSVLRECVGAGTVSSARSVLGCGVGARDGGGCPSTGLKRRRSERMRAGSSVCEGVVAGAASHCRGGGGGVVGDTVSEGQDLDVRRVPVLPLGEAFCGCVRGGAFGEDVAAGVARVTHLSATVGVMASRFLVAEVAMRLGGGSALEVAISELLAGGVLGVSVGEVGSDAISGGVFVALQRYQECVAALVASYSLSDVVAYVESLRARCRVGAGE